MPLQLWVAIIGLGGTIAWCVLWWAFQRHLTKFDKLARDMYEPTGRIDVLDVGLRQAIAKCLTSEDLDLNLAPLFQQLESIVTEGHEREGRILAAVASGRSDARQIQTDVQADIRHLSKRIDDIFAARGAQQQP